MCVFAGIQILVVPVERKKIQPFNDSRHFPCCFLSSCASLVLHPSQHLTASLEVLLYLCLRLRPAGPERRGSCDGSRTFYCRTNYSKSYHVKRHHRPAHVHIKPKVAAFNICRSHVSFARFLHGPVNVLLLPNMRHKYSKGNEYGSSKCLDE